jgi:dTDP-4-amino-4,6-dideoxygalactose transaminase
MIPFLDLKAQYASIKEEIDTAVLGVLASAQYVLGPEVSQFEEEFAAYCDAKHAVAVNTGTSALHLALLAAGVGPGDEVITVPFTFVATVSAVCYAGALPVFVDVEPVTLTMDPAKLEAAITPRTKAIVYLSICMDRWPTWTRSWLLPAVTVSLLSRMPARRTVRSTKAAAQAA